jgi:hypothetical protein
MTIKLHKIGSLDSYLWIADSQYEVTSTMLRAQECYESPGKDFQDKVFSLEDFMDWYAQTYGNFTYYRDWSGFNLPISYIKKLSKFKNKTKKEKALLESVKDIRKGYLIAIYKQDPEKLETFYHEFSHNLFNLNKEYTFLSTVHVYNHLTKKILERVYKSLKNNGYCDKVLMDEIVAFSINQVGMKRKHFTEFTTKKDKKQMIVLSKTITKMFFEFVNKTVGKKTWDGIIK